MEPNKLKSTGRVGTGFLLVIEGLLLFAYKMGVFVGIDIRIY